MLHEPPWTTLLRCEKKMLMDLHFLSTSPFRSFQTHLAICSICNCILDTYWLRSRHSDRCHFSHKSCLTRRDQVKVDTRCERRTSKNLQTRKHWSTDTKRDWKCEDASLISHQVKREKRIAEYSECWLILIIPWKGGQTSNIPNNSNICSFGVLSSWWHCKFVMRSLTVPWSQAASALKFS